MKMEESQMPERGEIPLESWKEIGAYLLRDARTARRWEKEEGLPVHRHVHKGRPSVYAFPSELDAWKEGRKPETEPEPEPERIALWGSPISSFATATLLLVALLWVGNTASEAQAQGLSDPGMTLSQFHLSDAAVDNVIELRNLSADGRSFGATDYLNLGVAIVDADTGEYRILTDPDDRSYVDMVAISRDGSRLAYWYYEYGATFGSLRVINADGSGDHILYEDPCREVSCEWAEPDDWSPDNKWILTMLERGEGDTAVTDIVLIPSEGGEPRRLASYGYRYRPQMKFSPDGNYIAYDYPPQKNQSESELWILPVEGGEPVAIASHPMFDRFLTWTPEGDILFASARGSDPGIYRVQIRDGRQIGEPELIRANVDVQWSYGFTPDGRFLYSTATRQSDALDVRFDFAGREVVNPPQPLSKKFDGATGFAAFSRDGSRAAYLRSSGANRVSLVVQDLATDAETELFPAVRLGERSRIRWHADGEHILVLTGRTQPGGIYQIDAKTGEAELVHAVGVGANFRSTDWTADARYIYEVVNREDQGKKWVVVRIDRQIGQQTELFVADKVLRGVNLSPDGERLAFTESRRDERGVGEEYVHLIRSDGSGQDIEVYHGQQPFAVQFVYAWTPGGEDLLFFAHPSRESQRNELWISPVDPNQGEPAPAGFDYPRSPLDLAVHPDGQRFVVTDAFTKQEYWAMENFLPASDE